MTIGDLIVERVARALPAPIARWILGGYFSRRFRRNPPCAVQSVTFVDLATFLGKPSGALDQWWGTPKGMVAYFEGSPYWLEVGETRRHILAGIDRLVAARGPLPDIVIDRSRVLGFGPTVPRHPAYHASFSLWRRMSASECCQLARSEKTECAVDVAGGDAWLFREETL